MTTNSSEPIVANPEGIIANHSHIILFDGLCNLCSGWVQFLIRRDPEANFHFCSVQSDVGQALLVAIGLPRHRIETMAYIHHGTVFLRSSAILEVTRKLPWLWPACAIGLIIPVRWRDWCYQRLANNRYRVAGKKNQCMVPSDEIKARFIEWQRESN